MRKALPYGVKSENGARRHESGEVNTGVVALAPA